MMTIETQRRDMYTEWFDSGSDPDIAITVSPRIMYADKIQIEGIMDCVHGELLRETHGSRWRKKHSTRMVMVPEIDSKRTKGSTPQLLHYHGMIWTDNEKLQSLIIEGGYEKRMQNQIEKRLPARRQGRVDVYAERFKGEGSWIHYAMKKINATTFTEGDIYLYKP